MLVIVIHNNKKEIISISNIKREQAIVFKDFVNKVNPPIKV